MEHASRRIIHLNVTAHPNAAWTLQQLREAIPSDHRYRFILHDRDAIFSTGFDASVARMGLEVIATPVRSPKANSLCERLIGTLRRECLDWIIPLTEQHLRKTLRSWLPHYNQGRPHSSLGPGLPDPPLNFPSAFATPKASIQPIKPSCGTLRPERTSPRVLPLGPRCMTVVEFLRTTVAAPASADRRCSALGVAVARLEMQARNGPGGRVCVVGRGLPPRPVAWAGLHSWPQRRVAVYPLLEPLDS